MNAFTWWVLAVALLAIVAVGLSFFGAMRWAEVSHSLSARLEAGQVPAPAPHYHAAELASLPDPVQRYFRAVLTDGQPIVSGATIHMAGRFNLSATGEQWRPFTSRQQVVTRRPGFLWDARIAMLPGVSVHVVDSYIGGEGLLKASVLGLVTMADTHGGGDIARGEFMRYFAEAVWYPTALLPSQGVRWEAVDDRSAKATMVDGPLALTLLFRFGETGLIESFRAEARGGMVGKVMVQAPWEGRFSDYRSHDGMSVPFEGEVAWMRPEGRKTYFQGSITRLGYGFAA